MQILVLCSAPPDTCNIYLKEMVDGMPIHTNIREEAKSFEGSEKAYEFISNSGLSYSNYYTTDQQTQDWLGELFRTFSIPFNDPETMGIAPHIASINDSARLLREARLANNFEVSQEQAKIVEEKLETLAKIFIEMLKARLNEIVTKK